MATSSNPEPTEARRRVVLRRRTGGFSSGGAGNSTHSESLRLSYNEAGATTDDGDIADEVLEPANLNERVRALAAEPPLMAQQPDDMPEDDSGVNPRQRLNDVAMAGSAAYAKEYRLSLLHRLLMRNVPLDQIARQLRVSLSTVEKDRAELGRRLREKAKQLNIDELIGNQMGVYDEIRAMSMRIASAGGDQAVPHAIKLASMRTALAAEADRTRFLNTAGVFDVLRYRRSEDGEELSDIEMMMRRTDEMLATIMAEEDGDPTAPKRVSRSRRNGHGKLTFDDRDSSNSSDEVVEL